MNLSLFGLSQAPRDTSLEYPHGPPPGHQGKIFSRWGRILGHCEEYTGVWETLSKVVTISQHSKGVIYIRNN